MTHLGTLNISYGQKKGRKSNCQFDSRPLKLIIAPISLRAGGMPHTYPWKALDKGYIFALNLTSIRGLHTKLWASKVAEILI
jgi:hypothetical protein